MATEVVAELVAGRAGSGPVADLPAIPAPRPPAAPPRPRVSATASSSDRDLEPACGGEHRGGAADPLGVVLLVSADPTRRTAWAHRLRVLQIARTIREAPSLACGRQLAATLGAPDLTVLDADLITAPDPTAAGDDPGGAGPLAGLGLAPAAHLAVLGDPAAWPPVRAVLRAGARAYLIDTDAPPPPPPPEHPRSSTPRPGPSSTGHGAGPVSARAVVLTATGEPSHLSPREVQILQAAADGHTTPGMARDLGLSPLTVKSHFARVRTRLHTGDRAHMVLLALRAGVIH